MNMEEFNKIKKMNYLQYCSYLQDKYGIPKADYMTSNWNRIKRISRANEGLQVHHLDEDKAIMLSTKEIAQMFPFEWQTKEHLVYCDMLEHLLLHVLICYYPSPERVEQMDVGIGGAVNFLIPELNDMYCGWTTKLDWKTAQHDKVRENQDVYLAIIKKFIPYLKKRHIKKGVLFSSFNESYGLWERRKNVPIYKKINKLWGWWFLR